MTVPSFRAVLEPSPVDAARHAVVVLGCRPGADAATPLPRAVAIGRAVGVDVVGQLRRAKATGAAGEATAIPLVAEPPGTATEAVVLVGVGDGSPGSLLRAAAAASRAAGARGPALVCLASAGRPGSAAAIVEGWGLAAYAVRKRSASGGAHLAPATRVDLAVAAAGRLPAVAEEVRRATCTVEAVHLARDLANTPANEKSPQWLASQAARRGRQAGLGVRVWDERELAAGGFGGLIGVGQGSARPPRLVQLDHRPRGSARRPHVVLCGKGIVFDSGGISIKPAAGMDSMKTDMAGAAAVLATMTALAALDVPIRVTGLLAIAENLPGDNALRPADVITPYGGRHTVEITNTDAEGRLVLADVLAYADLVLRPDAVIDIATLTGAASVALGRLDAPMYATDETLATRLLAASAASGERLWRMPLVDDYRPALDSSTADLVNGVTDRGLGGGSITAALFLREFAGGRPWAHLDIAGTGRSDAAANELSRGATGFGVRLLLRLLAAWPVSA